jgi:hypothetical protein
MKNSKEKAIELVSKFYKLHWGDKIGMSMYYPKQCALIACDEVIEYLISSSDIMISVNALEYWQQVKTEIKKL